MKLPEKMDEPVAGNSSLYVSADPDIDDPHAEDNSRDKTIEDNRDDDTAGVISDQLAVEWDYKKCEMHHAGKGNNRIKEAPSSMYAVTGLFLNVCVIRVCADVTPLLQGVQQHKQ